MGGQYDLVAVGGAALDNIGRAIALDDLDSRRVVIRDEDRDVGNAPSVVVGVGAGCRVREDCRLGIFVDGVVQGSDGYGLNHVPVGRSKGQRFRRETQLAAIADVDGDVVGGLRVQDDVIAVPAAHFRDGRGSGRLRKRDSSRVVVANNDADLV